MSLLFLLGFNQIETGVKRGALINDEVISFEKEVMPIINSNCAIASCHDGTMPPYFGRYRNISAYAERIKFRLAYEKNPMPPLYSKREIPEDDKQKILKWIDQGAPEN